jgi:hypothetical protein
MENPGERDVLVGVVKRLVLDELARMAVVDEIVNEVMRDVLRELPVEERECT